MSYLPIDYHILLQSGYDQEPEPKKGMTYLDEDKRVPRSNYVLFNNLPV